MDDLYREIILDHANNPRNSGTLSAPTLVLKEANASCGDLLEMQFQIENNIITDMKWRGVGCAISTASASMISEMIIGKTIKQTKRISEKNLLQAIGIDEILPTRKKCLTLALKLLEGLEEEKS